MTEPGTVGGPDPTPQPEHCEFDPAPYSDELAAAPGNHEIGTSLRFENDHVRVFEIKARAR